MIYRTIGVGGDFADYAAALAFLDGFVIAEDLTFDQISDLPQAVNMGFWNIQPNGYTVRFTCSYNTARLDDWQNWYKVYATVIDITAIFWNFSGAGKLIYDHFYIETTPGTAYTQVIMSLFTSGGVGQNTTFDCYNGYIDSQNRSTNGLSIGGNSFARQTHKYKNLKIWGATYGIYVRVTFPSAAIIRPTIENVSIYYDNIGGLGGIFLHTTSIDGKNIVVAYNGTGAPTDFINLNPGGYGSPSNFQNCACTDTSLTDEFPAESSNSQENIVPVDEFQSLDDTNADFLKLGGHGVFDVDGVANLERGKAPLEVQFTDQTVYGLEGAGVLADGGTAPTLTDTDIEGLDVPNTMGQYSIGCHQIPAE